MTISSISKPENDAGMGRRHAVLHQGASGVRAVDNDGPFSFARVQQLRATPVVPTLRWFCAALALAAAGTGAHGAEQSPGAARGTRSVLMLYSERAELPAIAEFEKGLRSVLTDAGGTTDFFAEYLDYGRFPREQHEAGFIAFLRDRYAGRRIDAVVSYEGAAPLNFLLRHRAELFPAKPVVAALDPQLLAAVGQPDGVSVVPITYDYRRTLELALALQPHIREVVVVHGLADFDHRRRDDAMRTIESFGARLRYRGLSGVALADMETEVAALPVDSIVLLVSMVRDTEGRSLAGREYAERLARVSSTPVYSTFITHVERGTLGGAMTDSEKVGQAAGAEVSRLLSGGAARGTAAVAAAPLVVNWQALKKWRIPPDRVPGDARVLYRDQGIWHTHRNLLLLGLFALLLQGLLIAGLVLQLRRRRRAERVVATLAHDVSQPLGAILLNAQTGLHLLEQERPDHAELRAILEDVVTDDNRAGQVISTLRSFLRLGRIEAGRIDLSATIRAILARLRGELARHQVEVDVALPAACFALADKTQVEQVLVNLVMNGIDAMRQCAPSERRLRVALSTTPTGMACIAVSDAGAGISEDKRTQVFDAFWTTKEGGMGMGLAVCKSIVESAGGRIWVDANEDRGVTFAFTLPLAPAGGT
jgi:signal transduction histidine kinase